MLESQAENITDSMLCYGNGETWHWKWKLPLELGMPVSAEEARELAASRDEMHGSKCQHAWLEMKRMR
jgi:hypothetical protein